MNVKIHLESIVHLIASIPMVVLIVHVPQVLYLIQKLEPVEKSMVSYFRNFSIPSIFS